MFPRYRHCNSLNYKYMFLIIKNFKHFLIHFSSYNSNFHFHKSRSVLLLSLSLLFQKFKFLTRIQDDLCWFSESVVIIPVLLIWNNRFFTLLSFCLSSITSGSLSHSNSLTIYSCSISVNFTNLKLRLPCLIINSPRPLLCSNSQN